MALLVDGLWCALRRAERFGRRRGILAAGVGVWVMEDVEGVLRLRLNPERPGCPGFPNLNPELRRSLPPEESHLPPVRSADGQLTAARTEVVD
jgi:hypothetical protein